MSMTAGGGDAAIRSIWDALEKDSDDELARGSFVEVMLKVALFMMPIPVDLDATARHVEDDWSRDASGRPSMCYGDFARSMSELAEAWCPCLDEDGAAQARFLQRVRDKITCLKPSDQRCGRRLRDDLHIQWERCFPPPWDPESEGGSEAAAAAAPALRRAALLEMARLPGSCLAHVLGWAEQQAAEKTAAVAAAAEAEAVAAVLPGKKSQRQTKGGGRGGAVSGSRQTASRNTGNKLPKRPPKRLPRLEAPPGAGAEGLIGGSGGANGEGGGGEAHEEALLSLDDVVTMARHILEVREEGEGASAAQRAHTRESQWRETPS